MAGCTPELLSEAKLLIVYKDKFFCKGRKLFAEKEKISPQTTRRAQRFSDIISSADEWTIRNKNEYYSPQSTRRTQSFNLLFIKMFKKKIFSVFSVSSVVNKTQNHSGMKLLLTQPIIQSEQEQNQSCNIAIENHHRRSGIRPIDSGQTLL